MLLMTHSLLSAWLRSMRDSPNEESETSLEEFMHVLRREKTPTTPAMQNGIDLEDLVTAILQGKKSARLGDEEYSVDQHPWYGAALKIAGMLGRAKLQYVATKTVRVDGVDFLLYGRLDALQAGEIFDIKYAGAYKRGKFYGSTQHPMYFELVPEAYDFVYIISDGYDVWTETYFPDQSAKIEPFIRDFMDWLRTMGLMQIYQEHWQART